MTTRRLFLRGTVLGFILWAAFPMGVAQATPSISISRASGAQAAGTIDISWTASASAGMRWARVEILGSHAPSGCRQGVPDCENSLGGPGSPDYQQSVGNTYEWNTVAETPWNGTYTFRVTGYSYEPTGAQAFEQISVLVNNPPKTPTWASGISSGKDGGKPYASFSWNYTGTEPDLREFQIVRSGPGGNFVMSVSSVDPSKQGCSASGANGDKTYTCTDAAFASSGYGGTYTYRVWALRSSPSGPDACRLDAAGNAYPNNATRPCIGRATSSTQSATIDEPSPTSNGGGSSGGGSGSGSGSGGTSTSGGGATALRPPPPGTTIVGGSRPAGANTDFRDFYTGEYSTRLPYQERTLLLPDGQRQIGGQETTTEVTTSTTPFGVPIKSRTVLLPMAAGLLLFLGAAHVKRLLTDR